MRYAHRDGTYYLALDPIEFAKLSTIISYVHNRQTEFYHANYPEVMSSAAEAYQHFFEALPNSILPSISH